MKIDNLIGQEAIKSQVRMQAEFCKQYNAVFPHTLLIASAGQGKTTMANAIAEIIGREIVQGYCPSIQTEEDLWALFRTKDGSWRKPGFILFLDEVHQLSLKMAEQLYTIMETFTLVTDGQVKPFPKFTLLAGTTEPHMMSKPLRDRFVNQFVFEAYTEEDMKNYIERLGAVMVLPSASRRIGRICNFTPRLVNGFMKKLHMYSRINKVSCVDNDILTKFLRDSGYTEHGLTQLEDKYMKVLAKQKKASLATISNLLSMKQSMVSTILEPALISRGLIELSCGGRVLTQTGYDLYGEGL